MPFAMLVALMMLFVCVYNGCCLQTELGNVPLLFPHHG